MTSYINISGGCLARSYVRRAAGDLGAEKPHFVLQKEMVPNHA